MKLPTEPGIYDGIAFEDYQRIDAVNWSTLKMMKKSPLHYRHAMREQAPDTDPMRLGRATHVAALEPERFARSWVKWDGGRRASKEWDKFEALAVSKGCGILTEDQWDTAQAIANAATLDEHAARYLRGGRAEVTMIWKDEATGILCKGRPDFGSAGSGALADLKTTRDASPEGFARLAWNLDYMGQASFYRDGRKALTGEAGPYAIVAVESTKPHAVQVFLMSEEMLDAGRDLYRGHLERLAWCRKEGRWPAYADGPLELGFPRWARPNGDEEEDLSGLDLEIAAG